MGEIGLGANDHKRHADLQEALLILMSVKPELLISWRLLTRTALAPFGREEIKIKYGEEEDKSAGRLVVSEYSDVAE